ncbi:MAG: hypothetical protein II888_05995 [Clostridia bacterium]|nr:hypothetical protein [Clostridia bacterium]
MNVRLLENRSRKGWTEFGGCFARGETREETFTLLNGGGQPVPVQSSIQARWPDGSVRWSRHTARAEEMGEKAELIPGGPAPEPALQITETPEAWQVGGDRLSLTVPKAENLIMRDVLLDGVKQIDRAWPVLSLAHTEGEGEEEVRRTAALPARIESRTLEEEGPLQAVFRFDGIHLESGERKMPFRIRLYIRGDGKISVDHTFFFEGDPETDRLAALGLRAEVPLAGTGYQRHIRFLTDGAVFHDNVTQLLHWRKLRRTDLLEAQARGEKVEKAPELEEAAADLPRWDRFFLLQDGPSHFMIRKKTVADRCWVTGVHGFRAPGVMEIQDPERSVAIGVRDFWEKGPSGLEIRGLAGEKAVCNAWFFAPGAEPYDFRHYDTRMYAQGCYEGFDYMMPDPNGIAVTSRCELRLGTEPEGEDELKAFGTAVRKPPVYLASPAYYHQRRAFGVWGSVEKNTDLEAWMENQIDLACDFYARERDARGWYGLFNYGDFMHTYQAERHQWRYDVGGYAWDNTELAPTYWLWLQALRTGKESVYSMAEALSRHAADVDMYHRGKLKGLGSRHNVRHWGCSCKEPRVSMAGHHRPLFYLAGDRRIGDCMEDALNAEFALESTRYYPQENGEIHLRSGPDWSSLVSNWMTAYERTGDRKWAEKIRRGIAGIRKAPLGLTSGPDFTFLPETGEMIYHGEKDAAVNMHLQACMAGPEIWLETAELMEDDELLELVAANGRYFFLSQEERIRESKGLLEKRGFGGVIYSAEMQAFSAVRFGNRDAAREIWRKLLGLLYSPEKPEGFQPVPYAWKEDGSPQTEIPWVSTNFTAQWCLKAIVCLDLIRSELPESLEALGKILRENPCPDRMYGA